ncbi:MAG: hypothetical protein IJ058_06610 [Lachnospiraceae bacterium]|nr:hypothetical protein [Lachnospiraceae bacterium]
MYSENTLKKTCSDTDPNIILEELHMYLPDIIRDNLEQDKGYYKLKDRDIWFSGDNLITRKQMYRRIFKKKQIDTGIQNDKEFVSYIILPFIKGNRYSGVNSLRAAAGDYNDNPFVFFEVLKEMFLCDFSLEGNTLDPVKKAIILTKNYWAIFGEGENGWNCYQKTFGLECLNDLKKIENNKKYFSKFNDKYEWDEYNKLLTEFKEKRIEELSSKS